MLYGVIVCFVRLIKDSIIAIVLKTRYIRFTFLFIYAILMLYKWIEGTGVDLCDSIKEIRRKCLMNQTEFADALGVSNSTVNRWENNKAIPNYQALKKSKNFVI